MVIGMWKMLLLGIVVGGLSACSPTTERHEPGATPGSQFLTFEETPSHDELKKTASGYLAVLLEDPVNVEVTRVKVNQALLKEETKTVVVALPTGKEVKFDLRYSKSPVAGDDSWQGWVGHVPSQWKKTHPHSPKEIDFDPFYHLSIVKKGDDLIADLMVAGQAYSLEQVASGEHVLIRVDESRRTPPSDEAVVDKRQPPSEERAHSPKSAHSTIRLLMVSTNQKREANPDYRLAMVNMVQTANSYLTDSKVDVTLEIGGYLDASYDEADKKSAQKLADMAPDTPLGKMIDDDRKLYNADLAVMVPQYADGGCGTANFGVKKENAFILSACSRSLANSLGRAFGGAYADRPEDATGYAYGFRSGDPSFHTMTILGKWDFINLFSNPELSYTGVEIGLADKIDMARFMNERRETIENFYP